MGRSVPQALDVGSHPATHRPHRVPGELALHVVLVAHIVQYGSLAVLTVFLVHLALEARRDLNRSAHPEEGESDG